jgi:class 3 adenylate cyclase
MLSALSPAPAQLLAAPKQAPPVFEASAPARVGEASSTGPPPEPATSAEARGAGSSGADKPLVRLNRAVLALDVAGSSRMKLAASTLAVQTKFALFRDFVRTQLRACSEAGAAWSGDGLIALFERSGDAANCAVAVLDGLSAFNAGTEGEPIRIRIGVHAGQVLMATGQPIGEVTSAVLDSAGHLQKHAPENSVLISERVFQGVDRPEAWQAAGPEYDLAFNFRVFQYGVARPAAATQEAADLRQLLKEFREQSTVVQSSTEAAPQQAPASRPKAGEPAPKMDRIVLEIDVDGTLTRHEIAGVTLIGRPDPSSSKESKIVVQSDDAISRRHALLSPFRGSFVIEDLNSANGTYLNGRMLSAGEPYPLAPEDRITIGEVTRIRVLPLDPKL